jgi:hypothetical protein
MSQTTIPYPLPIGFAGQLADTLDNDVLSYVSAEVSLEMPFGIMVAKGTGDFDGILPVSSGSVPVGVLVHAHVYDNGPNGELGTLGLKPKTALNILRRGRIYVLVEEAVVALDRAYIRYAAGSGGSQLGTFRKSADSATALDVTKKCQYLTSASAGGLALLDVDMLNS